MPAFTADDGTALHYDALGDGSDDRPPVILLHGFAATGWLNWVQPGIAAALVEAGRRVIMPDARGHGRSDKPHEPSAYADDAMVRDVRSLIDHLGLERVDVVGYSMGAMITSRLAIVEPRVRTIVLGGIGGNLLDRRQSLADAVADGLLADDVSTISDETARAFRLAADSMRGDRRALAAVQRGAALLSRIEYEMIVVPALVIVGDHDTLVGSPQELAARIPGARATVVTGDHLTAVMDPVLAVSIVAFLREADEAEVGVETTH